MKKEYFEKMLSLGISKHEAGVYAALLAKKELTAIEIHGLTNVPRTKVYEIIQKMKYRGMCIEKQMGRKKKYAAVEPRKVLNNLLNEYENDLEEKRKSVHDITKMILPIYNQGLQVDDVTEYVEIIRDVNSIHERFIDLIKKTKIELLSFTGRPYAHQEKSQKIAEQENAEIEVLQRGVVERVLYEFPNEEEKEWVIPSIDKCVEAGEKARMIEQVPVKMYVFDTNYVLMALENPKLITSPLTMLVIEHPGLAKAATLSFDYLWENAKDYRAWRSLREVGAKKR